MVEFVYELANVGLTLLVVVIGIVLFKWVEDKRND